MFYKKAQRYSVYRHLHCALSLAALCIVIGPVCVCVCLFVCLWVCYHDNSKLRASIFTKVGLYVKVVTISSGLNLGRPAPPGRGVWRGEIFWLRLTTASAQCLRLSERFFICIYFFCFKENNSENTGTKNCSERSLMSSLLKSLKIAAR